MTALPMRVALMVFAYTAVSPAFPGELAGNSARDIERGRYVVAISGCNECHTQGYLERGERMPEEERLTGSSLGWRGPWGTTYATNLRLYFRDITEEQWREIASEMQRRPPMPYYALNAMAESDLRAIYRYIRHLGPAGKPAPSAVPPTATPTTPYVSYPLADGKMRKAERRR